VDRHAFEIGLTPGQEVSIVFYVDGNPNMILGTVDSITPFRVSTVEPSAAKFANQRRAVILNWDSDVLSKIETSVVASHWEEAKWCLELEYLTTDESDRRRYPRYPMKLPVIVRTIEDTPEGRVPIDVQGFTEDLSLGGAWITLDKEIGKQSLVEIRTSITDYDTIRTLGVVARNSSSTSGIGVEFIDFIGGGRFHLFSFLNRVA
jgi:PilZ domain